MAKKTDLNRLYYGDNLDVLRLHIPDESVDLVYLDPPFNSNANYNVLFAEEDGTRAAAQIEAFGDTWQWDQASSAAFQETVSRGGEVANALSSFQTLLGDSNMLAYLAMMAPRLIELHRVLKPSGSIYLHCDPTASHYLKLLMDSIFGPERFINEISWKRSHTRSSISRSFRRAHDIILFYAKDKKHYFDVQYRPLSEASMKQYKFEDEGGRYRTVPLLVSGKRNGETGEVWRGIDPNERGKAGMHWVTTHDKLDRYEKDGLIIWPEKKGGSPNLKYYLDQSPGAPVSDFWDDIPAISSSSVESLGYPTQKPEALLKRIIDASCPKDGIVLDPFCGCGTTIDAAEQLGRRWIGIDITYLAVSLMKSRLKDLNTETHEVKYEVIGEPVSLKDAERLAKEDPYQFQWWALGLVGARPAEQKKGADKGIDGRIYFFDEGSKTKQVIISIKAGKVQVSHIRDLVGVLDREKAEIGVLISMNPPTGPMKKEAASAGFYSSPLAGQDFPRIQILTIEDLLNGKRIERPYFSAATIDMTAEAPKAPKKDKQQLSLGEEVDE